MENEDHNLKKSNRHALLNTNANSLFSVIKQSCVHCNCFLNNYIGIIMQKSKWDLNTIYESQQRVGTQRLLQSCLCNCGQHKNTNAHLYF